MTIASAAKKALKVLDNNSPLILTGLSVAGVVSTIVLAIRGSFEASEIIRNYEAKDNGLWVKSSPKERVKLTYHVYIPTAGMGAVTIACIIGAQSINSRRQTFLISGYTLAETAFREYREKVVEQIGSKGEQKVRDELAKKHVDEHPVSNQVIIAGNGDVLCYDTISGRYFKSDMETLRRAQNDINQQIINEMYASQNDFYRAIGVPINGFGEEFGWNTDVMLELQFSARIADNKEPCIVIDYRMSPIRGYYKMG